MATDRAATRPLTDCHSEIQDEDGDQQSGRKESKIGVSFNRIPQLSFYCSLLCFIFKVYILTTITHRNNQSKLDLSLHTENVRERKAAHAR